MKGVGDVGGWSLRETASDVGGVAAKEGVEWSEPRMCIRGFEEGGAFVVGGGWWFLVEEIGYADIGASGSEGG